MAEGVDGAELVGEEPLVHVADDGDGMVEQLVLELHELHRPSLRAISGG